jgi:hypothetical protein
MTLNQLWLTFFAVRPGHRGWLVCVLLGCALFGTLPARAQPAAPPPSTAPAAAAAASPAPAAPATTAAEPTDKERAKDWFNAGAAAYKAGDYPAAIQALDAAYALNPAASIAFSIAQAERRQYFVDRRPEHLLRSVTLFRRYLEEVPAGGRRADAIDALSQLEPLLAQHASSIAAPPAPAAHERSTRILVLCDTLGARISVDGVEPGASPLIREVTPGPHAVVVVAPGYRESRRELVAVQGEIVPITVSLSEQPSRLELSTPPDAEVYVDGVLVSQGGTPVLELASGPHRVSVAEKGHQVQTRSLVLERGQTVSESFTLEPTKQRLASHALLIGGAVTLGASAAVGILALRAENQAQDFLVRHEDGNVSSAELVRYNADVATRNRYRWIAGATFAASLGMLISGLFLHELDTPGPEDLYRSLPPAEPSLNASALVGPTEWGATLTGEF